jgi:hypothetical protein
MTQQMTETIADLATALSETQATLGAAKRDGKNPHFHSTFATLESVIDTIREPMAKHGLSYTQLPVHHPDGIGLTTLLMHKSGQYIGSTMVLPTDTQKGRTEVQAAGSTLSYMRRYALMALLGIPTEDDDGNAAGYRAPAQQRTYPDDDPLPPPPSDRVSPKQIGMFRALTKGMSAEQIAAGLQARGHTCEFHQLSKKDGSAILAALKEREEATHGS